MDKALRKNHIKSEKSVANKAFRAVCLVLLSLYTLSIILTFAFAFMTSLKTGDAYDVDLLGFPSGKNFTVNNYVEVLTVLRVRVSVGNGTTTVGIIDMLFNSLIFSILKSFFIQFSRNCRP